MARSVSTPTGSSPTATDHSGLASDLEFRHPLDHPVLASLTGLHAGFAERRGNAVRYQPDVSPFLAIPDQPTEEDWADLAALVGPGAVIPLTGPAVVFPANWQIVAVGDGVQMTGEGVAAKPDDEAVCLTAQDVPEMLALAERTKPGPFLPRTIELGTYLGIRRHGKLVAMAGERLHPPGWTEISAVCTDPAYQGQGLASRLVWAVAYGIRCRNETPFLHAVATNTNAIRLYESLGFRLRRAATFHAARVPGTSSS
jgi:predicted GNAT family acetyltransferase